MLLDDHSLTGGAATPATTVTANPFLKGGALKSVAGAPGLRNPMADIRAGASGGAESSAAPKLTSTLLKAPMGLSAAAAVLAGKADKDDEPTLLAPTLSRAAVPGKPGASVADGTAADGGEAAAAPAPAPTNVLAPVRARRPTRVGGKT